MRCVCCKVGWVRRKCTAGHSIAVPEKGLSPRAGWPHWQSALQAGHAPGQIEPVHFASVHKRHQASPDREQSVQTFSSADQIYVRKLIFPFFSQPFLFLWWVKYVTPRPDFTPPRTNKKQMCYLQCVSKKNTFVLNFKSKLNPQPFSFIFNEGTSLESKS